MLEEFGGSIGKRGGRRVCSRHYGNRSYRTLRLGHFCKDIVFLPVQSNATLGNILLAMARNADVMGVAQRQLGSITEGERFPDHSDIDDLPYILAVSRGGFPVDFSLPRGDILWPHGE